MKAPSKSMAFARYIDGYVARMPAAAKRLRGVSLEHRPALDVIQDYNLPATLFYLDPPYPQTVRYGNNNLYKDELMGEKDHRELLDRITDPSMVASVAISSYHSTLYDKALSGWACHEMKSRSAAGNDRTEVLWLNHETPNLLTFPAG